jgi:antitoxin MazE
MSAIVAKWGNSLAIRIPENLAKDLCLAEETEIDLDVIDGTLVMKPRKALLA